VSPLQAAGLVIAAYLLGSISPSLLLGRLVRGIDLREHGSGNLGATNAFRVLGKGLGTAVLVADLLKGFLPVLVARVAGGPWLTVLVALAALTGHTYSIWLRGKGGKGVATGAGALLAMMPLIVLLQILIWGLVFLATGYVSLASLAATLILPVLTMLTAQPLAYIVFSFVGAAVVVWAHRSNVVRLVRGTERRVTFRWHRGGHSPAAEEEDQGRGQLSPGPGEAKDA
jgi:glycerol-3-phosphate acyltransferase PlsY